MTAEAINMKYPEQELTYLSCVHLYLLIVHLQLPKSLCF